MSQHDRPTNKTIIKINMKADTEVILSICFNFLISIIIDIDSRK